MNRDVLLRTIAETGYNVGFGARKTFATFDIVEKAPGWIGFIAFAIGTFALFVETLAAKVPSAILLVAGFSSVYFNLYRGSEYEVTAKKLLGIHNKLRDLYRSVKHGSDPAEAKKEFDRIQEEYYSVAVSRQVFLSDWYAHYKFFAQSQIDWMDEELQFQFWRDMIPLSAKIFFALIIFAFIGFSLWLYRTGCGPA